MPIPKDKINKKPKTAKERIYNEIKKWIIEGTLSPDERVSDQEIAEYFSSSRTPVREAFQLLSDQKLINIFPGRETRVSKIDKDEAITNYKIMAELEILALEEVYNNIDIEKINALKKINGDYKEKCLLNQAKEAKELDEKFHSTLIEGCKNPFLTQFISIIGDHIERVENIFFKNIDLKSFETHEKIIYHLEKKDLDSAKNMIRKNWTDTLSVFDL